MTTTSYVRRLGLFSTTMAVMGGIIGGGIFRTPSVVATEMGRAGWILAIWAIGGLVALIGAFCFGELAARRPKAGGGYVYLRETLGPLPAFLYGWTLLLVIASGAIAAVAVTFADYFLAFLGLGSTWSTPVAVGAIVVLSGINYIGLKPGEVTLNLFTVLKLLGIALLVGAALVLALPPDQLPAAAVPGPRPGPWGMVTMIGAALVPVLFSYGGWQQTNFIAEEVVDAERTLPRALVIGVLGVVAVYLLANVAYLHVLGPAGLAASTAPASDVMTRLVGSRGGGMFIAAVIATSAFGFLHLVIMATPRVFQAMAADGVFFKAIATLHPRYRTPSAAILLQGGWALVLTISGTFAQLVAYVTYGDWIFFALTVSGLYVYRVREPSSAPVPLRFRVPGYPLTPALFIVASVWVVIGAVAVDPTNALIGTGLILLGVPVFLAWKRRHSHPTP